MNWLGEFVSRQPAGKAAARSVRVLLIAFLLVFGAGVATVDAGPFTYDAAHVSRADVNSVGSTEPTQPLLCDAREAPTPALVACWSTSTTPLARSVATEGAAPRFIDARGTIIDRVSIRSTVCGQRQARHVLGDRSYNGGSYFNSADDAQQVLDDFHSGAAEVLGIKGNDIVVRAPNVTGFNHNPGAGYPNQPTNVFFIKGSSSPSVVPYNPTWTP